MRDKDPRPKRSASCCREIGILMCYEVTRDLPLDRVEIETPLTRMKAPRIAGKKLVFAPILRAGMGLVDGMLDLVPAARVAHIGLYRDPRDAGRGRILFQGADRPRRTRRSSSSSRCWRPRNTAVAAVDRLKERGASDIRFVCLLAVPPSARAVARHPSRRAGLDRRDRRAPQRPRLHRAGPRRRRRPRLRHPVNLRRALEQARMGVEQRRCQSGAVGNHLPHER